MLVISSPMEHESNKFVETGFNRGPCGLCGPFSVSLLHDFRNLNQTVALFYGVNALGHLL